jgi:AcrR family transcriptional regulator
MPRSQLANEQTREESRQKILDAARKVFAIKGVGATISDVAEEAGISQGLAYRYFPSKEAILATLLKQMSESGGDAAARVRALHGRPRERLEFLISSILEARREQPEFYQLIYHILRDDKVPDDLRELMRESGNAFQTAMRRLVIEGQASGEIAPDNPDHLVGAILGALDGLSRRMLTLTPREAKASIPEAKIVMRMLLPDSDTKRGGAQ